MKIEATYYGINDGYGIVGWGFRCYYCRTDNNFVDEEQNEHECKHCKKMIKCVALKY